MMIHLASRPGTLLFLRFLKLNKPVFYEKINSNNILSDLFYVQNPISELCAAGIILNR